MNKYCLLAILVMIFTISIFSQEFKSPRPSPDATVSQAIGITKITIDYSCPGVKGRTIWGDLVPYGKIWRTGANEVTSITFDTPVKLNGNELSAGTYGIHTIPGEKEWTIIFSKNTNVNDPMDYDSTKDALRINIRPEQNPFTERMIFTFSDMTENSAKVNLMWEKLRVTFNVDVSTQDLVLQNARDMSSWSDLMNAANYCLRNNVNLDEGYKWIQASEIINENYWNQRIKAQYLAKMNKKDDAIVTMEKAIDYGNKMKEAPFDLESMNKMLSEWKSN